MSGGDVGEIAPGLSTPPQKSGASDPSGSGGGVLPFGMKLMSAPAGERVTIGRPFLRGSGFTTYLLTHRVKPRLRAAQSKWRS